MVKKLLLITALVGCNQLGPQVGDGTLDAPPRPDAKPDSPPGGPKYVLPAGTTVPGIGDNAELLSQIKIFDGLSDSALMSSGGVVTRSTGKAGGVTVMFWNFGSANIVDNYVVPAAVYMLANDDGTGVLTPRTDHPWLIDSIPGDPRYNGVRRMLYVPVTAAYAGEQLTSIEALNEAIELGLVGEPKLAGTWRNMPVVPPGTKLELSLGNVVPAMEATKVYARGYVADVLPMGYTQPLRNNQIPKGDEARLISGVATGGALPTALDMQPVFQWGIPAAPPTTAYNYTPIVTELDVRLTTGIAPATINNDNQLFSRATSGSINGYYPASVDSYVVTTTVSNKQIQFVDGAP